MARDLQDIPPAPSGICILIEDHFEVLKGLVNCSGDIESGSLEPFQTNQNYKAYLLNVNTPYYSTQIQVLSFDELSSYKEWYNSTNDSLSALFICIDVNKSEDDLKSFLQELDDLQIDKIDTRSLLLFGTIPCSIKNIEHPKAQLIQKFVEQNYIETVKFQPNEEESEELEENHEIYGIARVWELLGIVDWSTKILKKGAGLSSLSVPTGLPSSLSTKCKAAKRPVVMENFCRQSQDVLKSLFDGMEPTANDEECIYNFLLNAKRTIPEPEVKQHKVPPLSMQYLMEQRERVQKGVRLSREDNTYKHPSIPNMASNQIRPIHLLSTEATLRECPQNLNTRMSIFNTTKQFQPDKETRAGSTSINVNVRSTTNTDPVSSVVQEEKKTKKKSSKNKKPAENEPNTELKEEIKDEDGMKEIKAEIERIYDQINNRGKPINDRPLNEWVVNWSNVKDNPPNDNNVVYVATQLTKTFIEQNNSKQSDLTDHLASEIQKMSEEKTKKEESKKDK